MSNFAMQHDRVVNTLNRLIEMNLDAQRGYQEAAEKMETPQVQEFCFEQIRVRAQFVRDLQPPVLTLEGHPRKAGSVAAAVHRGWIDLKSSLGGGDRAILTAIETGEDHAVRTYKNALDETLPPRVRDIVERQFESVKQAQDKVNEMRDSLGK
jgi:uncharacterized protein (TIGR02284 family)